MILEELTVHNFGVYAGRQVCPLATTPSQPLVLIGGLNGAGKTTFMDAIQLAIYGKFARCSNRGRSYTEYLQRSIHAGARPSEGAAVKLRFRYRGQGEDHTYHLHRSWRVIEGTVREQFDVLEDGRSGRWTTDTWNDHIESLLPINLSQLFFFDGERIEALADLDRSAEFLETAMDSLLGLHLVTSLRADMSLLERRKRREQMPAPQRDKVIEFDASLERLMADRADHTRRKGATQNELDRHQKERVNAEKRAAREGADLLEQRQTLENTLKTHQQALALSDDLLRTRAAGELPLLIVQDLLEHVREQDDNEQRVAESDTIQRLLKDRDASTIAEAKHLGVPDNVLNALQTFLAQDCQRRESDAQTSRYLALSTETRNALSALLSDQLVESQCWVHDQLADAAVTQTAADDIERTLEQVPEEESVAALLAQRREAFESAARSEREIGAIEGHIQELNRQITRIEDERAREEQRRAEDTLDSQDAERIIHFSGKARGMLETFRSRVVINHIANIEREIVERFQSLLRKSHLIGDLHIDPRSFALTLNGADGALLPADRLSAGERQLLAISILWGLHTCSKRPLPVVIDTPLGRLDRSHRDHVVQGYFPRAGQQVILLSTDEEIGRSYHKQLATRIAHSYTLDFCEDDQATSIKPGYFW